MVAKRKLAAPRSPNGRVVRLKGTCRASGRTSGHFPSAGPPATTPGNAATTAIGTEPTLHRAPVLSTHTARLIPDTTCALERPIAVVETTQNPVKSQFGHLFGGASARFPSLDPSFRADFGSKRPRDLPDTTQSAVATGPCFTLPNAFRLLFYPKPKTKLSGRT